MAVLFLLYVVAEVAAVVAVASAIGILPMLGILLAGAIVGSWLARREGGKAMRAFAATARSGKSAHNEVTDGMLIALGGLLILVPGFVSDVFGLLLLLPPTRSPIRRTWLRRVERRTPMAPMAYQRPEQVIVVDSEVVDDRHGQGRDNPPGTQHRPVIDPG